MAGKTTVGLDIGTSSVRGAQLAFGKGAARLERFGQVALPPGAVRGGEVVDVAAVSAALRQLWSATKFSSKRVALGVANAKVVVRQVDLPWLPPKELRQSLGFQVSDYVPMPLDQAILDVHPLEEWVDGGGARQQRVLLVAAARDMVGFAVAAAEGAGLSPVGVDLTPFALLRSLASVDELGLREAGAEAVVDVGAHVTNIVVHEGGVPRFVRILLRGGGHLSEALSERLGIPLDQAEALKQSSGVATTPGEVGGDPASRVVELEASAFVDEVRGSLDYYASQPGAPRVARLVVSGGGAQLTGLGVRLAASTGLPVEQASPLPSLTIGKTGLSDEQLAAISPLSAVPVGLALGAAA